MPAASHARTASHDHAQPFIADETRPYRGDTTPRAGFASFDAAFAVAAGLPGMPSVL
jgi:hypothetical protein